LCTTVVHNTTQNSSDNLPSYLQTNTIAQILSIRGEETQLKSSTSSPSLFLCSYQYPFTALHR